MARSTTQAANVKPKPLSNDEPEKDPGTKTHYGVSGSAKGSKPAKAKKPKKAKDPVPDTGKPHYSMKG